MSESLEVSFGEKVEGECGRSSKRERKKEGERVREKGRESRRERDREKHGQGRRQKNFGGFPKWCKQNSRECGGHSSPDAEGTCTSHFCTTFVAVFTKLVLMMVINNLCMQRI